MPTKSKSTKRQTKIRNIPKESKDLGAREQKKIKGGQKTYQVANFNFKVGGLPS
ncbi:MAG TPA: hypothetical protein VJU86_10845 [Pyrinomonadaceae bacterium]|nr:hypothetical protein [Pyrinomonadaceae bacterium]